MEKICQIIPPGTLSMFYILWTPTDRPQINIFALVPPDPGGTAIVCNSCSKKCSKWKMDATFKQKKLLLPQISVNEIDLGRTVLEL